MSGRRAAPSRAEHDTICSVAIEFSQRIGRIPVYPAAGGYAQQEPLVRLASNESPFPPLEAVREAIDRALGTLNRYPDPSSSLLRQKLSDRYGVPRSRIAIGNGSCDILLAAGEALLEPGAEVVYAWPSFSVYPHLAAASGARAVTVGLDEYARHDLQGMLREITVATRLVLVCNPNNPTSTAVPLADIAAFLDEVPGHVCVILDEAYCEFNTLDDADASLELLEAHPNLALLRTFSKVHGLCGLRVGFALCGSEDLPRALDQVRQPFFCNALAQAAAVEALAHQDAVEERVIRTVAERISVDERLRALGIEPADSQANFCWFTLGEGRDEQEVMRGLQERGVLVRGGSALGSDVPALRVTYGLPEENARFLDALAEVLALSTAR
jgi:histidinol-phosphate aminotransferase